MAECWRVLKPTGSAFVNLGDKRSGSGGHNNAGLAGKAVAPPPGVVVGANGHGSRRRNAPDRYNQAAFGRPKSKMLLPHRFAIGCEDGLADPEGRGWIVRQDVVWAKPNGLPESVTDRCRDSHEYLFHLVKQERYFSAVDEVREPHYVSYGDPRRGYKGRAMNTLGGEDDNARGKGFAGLQREANPLGKLPGSVWAIPSEPLRVPEDLGVEHFAAFPTALPLRCIKGWSPSGICVECGQGRRPLSVGERTNNGHAVAPAAWGKTKTATATGHRNNYQTLRTITGYACGCPDASAPTRPAVVLDVFGGTGTTAAVARALGRLGVSVDLSADYCRLARWRIFESGDGERAVFGERPPRQIEGQGSLFEGVPRRTA